jgi:hypothetical protein
LGGFFICYHKYIHLFFGVYYGNPFSVISNSATTQLATSVSPVNEGSSSTITLTTTGIQNGQAIPYTISGVGITSDDISGEPLTGNFIVQNGSASKVLNIAADLTTEGQETLTLSLGSQFNSTNVSLAINDTSLTPVAGDIYQDNNVLLMHFDGANNSTTFTDVKGHTFTRVGSTVISTSQSKFGGSSGYFNGTDAALTTPFTQDFHLNGTTSWTIEGWFRLNGLKSQNTALSIGTFGSSAYIQLQVGNTAGEIVFAEGTGWGWQAVATTSGANLAPGSWYHIAIVRNGSNLSIYRNGVAVYNSSSFAFSANSTATTVYVGSYFNQDPSWFNGYVDDLRITKGVARYTSNFTVPDAAFSDLKNENVDPFFNNVTALLHFDGNATDVKGHTFTSTGVTYDAVNRKFGQAAVVTNSPVTTEHADFAVGTSDFTIEMWVNPLGTTNDQGLFHVGTSLSPGASGLAMAIKNNLLYYRWDNTYYSLAGAISAGTWSHIALTRSSGVVCVFVNGVRLYTNTNTSNYTGGSLQVGRYFSSAYGLSGRMDDFRFTKGVARYITNFTPPSRAFADNA